MITPAELRATGAFASFTDRDLEVLLTVLRHRVFEPGAALCRQGAPGNACYVILSGEVEVVKGEPPVDRVLTTLRKGAVVGQLALVQRTPRTASVRARTRVETLELGRDAFDDLLKAHSPMALRFQLQVAVATARQLRDASARLTRLLDSAPGGVRSADPAPEGQRLSRRAESLRFLQAAAGELGVSLDSLDDIEVVAQPRLPQSRRPPRR